MMFDQAKVHSASPKVTWGQIWLYLLCQLEPDSVQLHQLLCPVSDIERLPGIDWCLVCQSVWLCCAPYDTVGTCDCSRSYDSTTSSLDFRLCTLSAEAWAILHPESRGTLSALHGGNTEAHHEILGDRKEQMPGTIFTIDGPSSPSMCISQSSPLCVSCVILPTIQ